MARRFMATADSMAAMFAPGAPLAPCSRHLRPELLPVELHMIHAVALVADLVVHDRGGHVDLLLVAVAQQAQVALRIAAGGRCGLVATGLLRGAPRRDPALELLTLLRRDRIALCRKFVGELLGAEAFRPVEAGQRAALLEV